MAVTATEVDIAGFRSVRSLHLPLRRLTVLVGANGVGKTNLYRALELLRAAAAGTLADEIALEGGLGAIFWAGGRNLTKDGCFDPAFRADGYRRGEGPPRLKLGVTLELDGLAPRYAIEIGFPDPTAAAFPLEAQVKTERLDFAGRGRRVVLLERNGPTAWRRDGEGRRQTVDEPLLASEVALAGGAGTPEIDAVRQSLAAWRFFHGFRTDRDSPLRKPCRAVTAPLLAADGSNLAAVFATLRHIREETQDIDAAIAAAFPGAELVVPVPDRLASFGMIFPETPKRVFEAHELSDGTLHFLALMGALLSYRLPPFVALNEPETSLHPDLLPALARIIARAAERTQVWVVTHSRPLADALTEATGALPREVIRRDGATWLDGLTPLGGFADDD
jgi:predicted ATPase